MLDEGPKTPTVPTPYPRTPATNFIPHPLYIADKSLAEALVSVSQLLFFLSTPSNDFVINQVPSDVNKGTFV